MYNKGMSRNDVSIKFEDEVLTLLDQAGYGKWRRSKDIKKIYVGYLVNDMNAQETIDQIIYDTDIYRVHQEGNEENTRIVNGEGCSVKCLYMRGGMIRIPVLKKQWDTISKTGLAKYGENIKKYNIEDLPKYSAFKFFNHEAHLYSNAELLEHMRYLFDNYELSDWELMSQSSYNSGVDYAKYLTFPREELIDCKGYLCRLF